MLSRVIAKNVVDVFLRHSVHLITNTGSGQLTSSALLLEMGTEPNTPKPNSNVGQAERNDPKLFEQARPNPNRNKLSDCMSRTESSALGSTLIPSLPAVWTCALRLLILSLGGGGEVVEHTVQVLERRPFFGHRFPALKHHVVQLLWTLHGTSRWLGHSSSVAYKNQRLGVVLA